MQYVHSLYSATANTPRTDPIYPLQPRSLPAQKGPRLAAGARYQGFGLLFAAQPADEHQHGQRVFLVKKRHRRNTEIRADIEKLRKGGHCPA